VSLTFTPMLSSRFLRAHGEVKHGRLYNATERAYDWTLDIYKRTLDWAMLHRGLMMVFSVLVLVGTGILLKLVPTGFIPTQDTGSINITTEAGSLVRLAVTEPALIDRVRQSVEQSIQIIERRVNELGTGIVNVLSKNRVKIS